MLYKNKQGEMRVHWLCCCGRNMIDMPQHQFNRLREDDEVICTQCEKGE